MSEINLYKCPECGGDACDHECGDCDGLGTDLNDEVCLYCDGDCTIYGEFECNECGHIYNENDLY